jgi:hypothetical protein
MNHVDSPKDELVVNTLLEDAGEVCRDTENGDIESELQCTTAHDTDPRPVRHFKRNLIYQK